MFRVGLLLVVVACSDNAKTIGDARPDDAAVIDAAVEDAPIDAPPGPYLAVASDNQILFFSPTDSGNTAPRHVLSGPATELDTPRALATAGGELFVVNRQSITVYPYTASGDTAPLRTITGPLTGLTLYRGHELAVANDEVYVVGSRTGGAVVSVFPAHADGDVAPIRRIENTSLDNVEPSSIAVSDDEIFIGSLSEVMVYPVDGNGDIASTRAITGTPSFSRASSIDFAGTEMFIAREQFLFALPASAAGVVTPLRTITGGVTGLPFDDVEIDVHDGAIYATAPGKVLAFPATGSGNLSPIRAIYGDATMLGVVRSLVVVP
jgi:hypothetical protein